MTFVLFDSIVCLYMKSDTKHYSFDFENFSVSSNLIIINNAELGIFFFMQKIN